jgi:hypothetical protein
VAGQSGGAAAPSVRNRAPSHSAASSARSVPRHDCKGFRRGPADLKAVERRQQPGTVPEALVELLIDESLDIPPAQRFVPPRPAIAEIMAISPIAPARAVRIVHGPVKTANLNVGVARMFIGEEHRLPARAAHALVTSGMAAYIDETATAAA